MSPCLVAYETNRKGRVEVTKTTEQTELFRVIFGMQALQSIFCMTIAYNTKSRFIFNEIMYY